MPQEQSNTGRAERSWPDLTPPEFIAMGKKRIKELAEIQTELFEKFREVNQSWLDRMQTETSLASVLSPWRQISRRARSLQG
jgi:hypothetical protein